MLTGNILILTASVSSNIGVLGVIGAVEGVGVEEPNGVATSLSTGVDAMGDNNVTAAVDRGAVYHWLLLFNVSRSI